LTGLSAGMVATPAAWRIFPSATWQNVIGVPALNHGASRAPDDAMVFVHQDVSLPSLPSLAALIRSAGPLRVGGLGVLGAWACAGTVR
jgi:hypothetical protein